MVTVSTFKCIFLKYCLVYASTQMYFFTSANAFQMLLHGDCFHSNAFFSKVLRLCIDSNVFFHCRKCIPNALSWRLLPHSNAFSQTLSGLCLDEMYFFHFQKCVPNALSWWLFPHSNAFFSNIVRFCVPQMYFFTSIQMSTRASARTRARTEQISQTTPCKYFFPDMDI